MPEPAPEGEKPTEADLFIQSLLSEPKEKKRRKGKAIPLEKIKVNQREVNHARYSSSVWKDEAIILLIIKTQCIGCGRTHTSPHSFPMLRRFHPRLGIHEEALGLRPSTQLMASLPQRIEEREVEVPCCQLCFGFGREFPVGQHALDFNQAEVENGTPIIMEHKAC